MYHYPATTDYPYLNGGFRGSIELSNGAVANQPRARGVRPYTRPLRGATITGFEVRGGSSYRLHYELGGKTHSIRYSLPPGGGARFVFVDSAGRETTEVYELSPPRGERRGGPRGGQRRADGPRP